MTSFGKGPLRRLVVCVDGDEYDSHGKAGNGNCSNIFRLKSIIPNSRCQDLHGRAIDQIVRYYQAVGDGPSLVGKLRSKVSAASSEQQIKEVTKEICQTLEESQDELYLYGFGRGAYIVRAVSGLMHHMRLPKRKSLNQFDEIFKNALDLYKARREDDSRNGPKIVEYLRANTIDAPQIRFIGIFDTVKYATERHMHDLSFNSSIQNLRHALAFNETRSAMTPEIFPAPAVNEMEGRTMIQAWFIGSHQDLGGGAQHDGLSLYALQWMILESMKAGLIFRNDSPSNSQYDPLIENALALTFPQYAGGLPNVDGTEKIEWKVNYANGIQVKMYDLATLHSPNNVDKDETHTIRINQSNNIYNTQRKVFSSKSHGLIGWCDAGSYGTIIHPSVFCLLDRYPRLFERSRSRTQKEEIADFRERCLKENEKTLPPWLEGVQLQASDVKAFRILVCGKTGVGKSTLINKVFGVEMTEESNTYQQGKHDINKAFESINHPGLLIHDSRGWQAGTDTELDLIAKFLRHRAFQKDPAEALHVVWFCVDADVSRVEEADKRTFETIAQYSHHVPVFVIGTKRDKVVAFRQMQLLQEYMKKNSDYHESNRLASIEADRMAEEQFLVLREELSQIKHYKADGYCCLSKDDDVGIKKLLSQTLDLITDDRVRLFCVAAQVVDVEQKIDSAITECMRLGTHAVRTSMLPLPFSSTIGTPTVSRILCEHVLQCFGFPKAMPDEVEDIMSRVVLGNLRSFMIVTMAQFLTVGIATAGLIVGTVGAGGVLGLALCVLAAPPTARMLFKCACDMILILERSFRYKGKYVSVKQIEDAAIYYTTATTKSFAGKEMRLQAHVHNEIDKLIPLSKVSVGIRFGRLRSGLEEIVYKNRFEKPEAESDLEENVVPEMNGLGLSELHGESRPAELGTQIEHPLRAELEGDMKSPQTSSRTWTGLTEFSDATTPMTTTASSRTWSEDMKMTRTVSDLEAEDASSRKTDTQETIGNEKSENLMTRSWKAMSTRRLSSKLMLKKSKTGS